jgi:hypothetical protein
LFIDGDYQFSRRGPITGTAVSSLNQDWFFGFWIGASARIGN